MLVLIKNLAFLVKNQVKSNPQQCLCLPNTSSPSLTEKTRLADLLGLELWVEPAQEEEEELPDLPGVGSLQLQPLQVLLLQHTHKDQIPN
jgi:hypothetical protein